MVAKMEISKVTILILVDGFLQYDKTALLSLIDESHNPYFSRWFSAIWRVLKWKKVNLCHNPYFSRWFSAMWSMIMDSQWLVLSQSLF